jgi:hypothetical protein
MSSTKKPQISETLTEDQIKFWLANTSLTKEQLVEWYKSFHAHSLKSKTLDKENFVKFFNELHHSKKDADSFYNLMFTGIFYLELNVLLFI